MEKHRLTFTVGAGIVAQLFYFKNNSPTQRQLLRVLSLNGLNEFPWQRNQWHDWYP